MDRSTFLPASSKPSIACAAVADAASAYSMKQKPLDLKIVHLVREVHYSNTKVCKGEHLPVSGSMANSALMIFPKDENSAIISDSLIS